MPKLVCVECEVEYKPLKNGIVLAEMFQENTKIYRLLRADIWQCPICSHKVVAGVAETGPEHHEEDLEKRVELLKERGEIVIMSRHCNKPLMADNVIEMKNFQK